MLRRAALIALFGIALTIPSSASAQSFSFCNSITSGSCFSGWTGGTLTLDSSSFQGLIESLITQLNVGQLDLSNLEPTIQSIIANSGRTMPPVSVPEPGTLSLLATGILGIAFVGRRKRYEN